MGLELQLDDTRPPHVVISVHGELDAGSRQLLTRQLQEVTEATDVVIAHTRCNLIDALASERLTIPLRARRALERIVGVI